MKFPNIFRALKSAYFSALYQLRGYKIFVSPEIEESRTATCEVCPEFLPEYRQCGVCTCFVDAKALFASEACPKGRWNRVKVLAKD